MMSLRTIDLNLVPILQTLLREKSVSRAADALALSQPAVSAALGRLRLLFGDQLLVRVGHGMALTPRALALIPRVETACDTFDSLFVKLAFDPALERRTFVIALPDQEGLLLAPRWLRVIEREAPHVRLRFVELGERTAQDLVKRDVDFAIMPSFFLEDLPPAPLHYRPLVRDPTVAMFRADHPLAARDTIAQADLEPYRMLAFHPGFDRIEHKRSLTLMGPQHFDVVAEMPQATLSPFLLLDSDYFGIFARRMAERLAETLPLAWRPFGFATNPLEMGLAWSQVQDGDLAHCWFRDTVVMSAFDDKLSDRPPLLSKAAAGG